MKVSSTDIPADARRAWTEYDRTRDALMVVLEHPSFPEVDPDEPTKFLRLEGPRFTAFEIRRDVETARNMVTAGDTDAALEKLTDLLALLDR